MGCTVRGKRNERVKEATRVVWVYKTEIVTMRMRMEAQEE